MYKQFILITEYSIVENLFGRKRLFLGPIHPAYPSVSKSACLATYREGYAQLPQSTTADKINEHDGQIAYLFEQVEKLMVHPEPPKNPIGYVPDEGDD